MKRTDPRKKVHILDGKMNNISEEVRSLLKSMIEFNPYFRQSAKELLRSEVFGQLNKVVESVGAEEKVLLEVDCDDVYDYEDCKQVKFDTNTFMEMILKEASSLQQN